MKGDFKTESEDYISETNVKAIRRRLLKWGTENFKDFPWRETKKLWHALAAEVLLQRTRAGNVVETYNKFVSRFNEPSDLANASLEEIEELLYTLGLPARTPYLKQLGAELAGLNGVPPTTLDDLIKLPAIGPYSAAAYLSFHSGKRAVIVDANVVRWICRLLDRKCDAETRRKKWLIQVADELTPARRVRDYNYAVLDFTMTICNKNPDCEICSIGPRYCLYGKKVLAGKVRKS